MRMTKEMYESLQVRDLKGIAERRDLAVPSRVKKQDLIEMLLNLDREEDERVLKERAAKAEAENAARAASNNSDTGMESAPGTVSGRREHTGSRTEDHPEHGKGEKPRRKVVRVSGTKEGKKPVPEPGQSAGGAEESATAGQSAAESAAAEQTADASGKKLPVQAANPAAAGSAATADRYARRGLTRPDQQIVHKNDINPELDSGEVAHGIIEVMQDGFGFIRSDNYMPGENDVYVAPSQIRRFSLKTGDIVEGNIRVRSDKEKFSALLYVKSVNGMDPEVNKRRYNFEDMTPIFPDEKIRLEKPGASIAMRVMDLMCPVGKGQRGLIVSPPKAGKTTLVKEIAKSVKTNSPEIHLIILLIDERPEEVTDIREALEGPNVEVIYSTFDELPEHHKRVAEMTIERAKRLVEHKKDVMILLDSITRLTRAYNLTEPSSGRTLSGGLDPVALHMPKRFFGAARNMREGGSLTILATALIETGSKMDDVVYEEFKGTGNMEMILNRKLSERRIFPAVDLAKSGTRRDDLLLTPDEQECVSTIRRSFIGARGEEATDSVLDLFYRTRTNGEFVSMIKKHMWSF